VFVSERGAPFSTVGFRKMIARLGKAGGFKFGVHPHMLRHAWASSWPMTDTVRAAYRRTWGTSIQHTVRYTELSRDRFKRFWKD
jgi:site-specific recombinase XerD